MSVVLSQKNASWLAMGSLPTPELPIPSQPAGEVKGKMYMADVREAEGRPDSALIQEGNFLALGCLCQIHGLPGSNLALAPSSTLPQAHRSYRGSRK